MYPRDNAHRNLSPFLAIHLEVSGKVLTGGLLHRSTQLELNSAVKITMSSASWKKPVIWPLAVSGSSYRVYKLD